MVAVVALTDRVEPADPPVRWGPMVGRPDPRGVRRPGGGSFRGAAGPARPGVRPRPAPTRAVPGRPRSQHPARPGLGFVPRLLPRLAERVRRPGTGAGQHGLRPGWPAG